MYNNSSSQHTYGNGTRRSGTPSQNSSQNNRDTGTGLDPIKLQSDVLEDIQTITLEYDQLSPDQVRSRLRALVEKEKDAKACRE